MLSLQDRIEFGPGTVDINTAAKTIRDFGCVILRQALEPGLIASLARAAVRKFSEYDKYSDQEQVPPEIPYKVLNG